MRHTLRRLFEWAAARWGVTASLAVTAVLALGSQVALLLRRVVAGSFNINVDSAIFLHTGWYAANGAVPYEDFFFLKPPLAFETTMVFALLGGDDSRSIFLLSVVATVSLVIFLAPVWVMGPGILLNPVAFDSPSPEDAPFRSDIDSLRATVIPDDGPLPPEVRDIDRSEHMKQLFWNLERPESCHYRLSGNGIKWVEQIGGDFEMERCGQTPQFF